VLGVSKELFKKPFALETSGLTVCYHDQPVVWNVDLQVPSGLMVAIVGPNGAGKSSLIKASLNLVKPLSGTVKFLSQSLSQMCLDIAYVPQKESVDWNFPITVYDLVMMGRYGRLGWFKRPTNEDEQIVNHAIAEVGLGDFKKRQISELSGGQQQRAFLARALAQQAKIYFMDEPFAAVDHTTERQLILLMQKLCREGASIFVVHHDLSTLEQYFDWLILLNKQLIASGSSQEVLTSNLLEQAYERPLHFKA
jgi:manganese/zinc/iron transport system ATP- binding protein